MKLFKILVCTLSLFVLGACDQFGYKTDVEFLKKYIRLDFEPVQVQYNVREDWGMDCPKLTQIEGILKFSDQDFKQLVDSLKKEEGYKIPLSKGGGLYKRWYPSHLKKLIKENKVMNCYNDKNVFQKKDKAQIMCFITDSCEIIMDVIHCE